MKTGRRWMLLAVVALTTGYCLLNSGQAQQAGEGRRQDTPGHDSCYTWGIGASWRTWRA
jgi:hypothetical protein